MSVNALNLNYFSVLYVGIDAAVHTWRTDITHGVADLNPCVRSWNLCFYPTFQFSHIDASK